jgi:hypothetical protein
MGCAPTSGGRDSGDASGLTCMVSADMALPRLIASIT